MTATNSLSEPVWLADRGIRSGRCRNDFYCLLANTNRTLRIKSGESFICPECLKPLKLLPDPVKPRSSWRIAGLMIGGGLAATALCLLVASPVLLGRHTVPVFVVIPTAQNTATAESIAIPPQMPESPLISRNLANQPIIAYRELAPLQPQMALPYRAARPTEQIASHHVPSNTWQNRGFSGVPVAGGEPEFPDLAHSQKSTGLVQVTCRIETNGTPTDCQANAVRGGHTFSSAVSSWLKTGSVRFAPILQHGQPVAEVNSWDIEFSPDLPGQ